LCFADVSTIPSIIIFPIVAISMPLIIDHLIDGSITEAMHFSISIQCSPLSIGLLVLTVHLITIVMLIVPI